MKQPRLIRLASLLACGALAVSALVVAPASATGLHRVARTVSSGHYPITVSTTYGPVTLRHKPRRIISLSPTTTEMLFAIGAGRQVIAVDADSNYPKSAPKTQLSGYTPNVESIAALRPDLVVISYNPTPPNLVTSLKLLGIPTLFVPAALDLQQSYAEIIELGLLTGQCTGASKVVRSMKSELNGLVGQIGRQKTPGTYFYELDPTLYTATGSTFIGSVLGRVGLKNIVPGSVAGSNYPQITPEAVVRANPTFIFLADNATPASVAMRPGWSSLRAVRTHHVVQLNQDVASRWGPRTVDLLREVVRAIKGARIVARVR